MHIKYTIRKENANFTFKKYGTRKEKRKYLVSTRKYHTQYHWQCVCVCAKRVSGSVKFSEV